MQSALNMTHLNKSPSVIEETDFVSNHQNNLKTALQSKSVRHRLHHFIFHRLRLFRFMTATLTKRGVWTLFENEHTCVMVKGSICPPCGYIDNPTSAVVIHPDWKQFYLQIHNCHHEVTGTPSNAWTDSTLKDEPPAFLYKVPKNGKSVITISNGFRTEKLPIGVLFYLKKWE